MARSDRFKRRAGRKIFSIIVDGDTEVWYFQLMKQEEKMRFDISPRVPLRKTIEEQYETVCENACIYDHVYWILDLDVIIKEYKQRSKTKLPALEKLKKYVKKIESNERITLLINNPCLEYWFLLHFENTSKYYSSCSEVIKELKKNDCLCDYSKSERYYKNQRKNIYTKLKPYQEQAILNAKALEDFDCETIESGYAELYKVIERLITDDDGQPI